MLDDMDQLIQLDKPIILGSLIGGLTHELNNPLAGALSSVQLLLEEEDVPPAVIDIANDIETCVVRCAEVLKSVSNLLHVPENPKCELVSANGIIKEVVNICARLILPKTSSINLELCEDDINIYGVAGQYKLILVQLITLLRRLFLQNFDFSICSHLESDKLVIELVGNIQHGSNSELNLDSSQSGENTIEFSIAKMRIEKWGGSLQFVHTERDVRLLLYCSTTMKGGIM